MELKTKLQMKQAFSQRLDKKELYRLLTIAQSLGLTWNLRHKYGGGVEVTVWDNLDAVVVTTIFDDEDIPDISVSFNDDYFTHDFRPSYIYYFNEETLAEIKNEEALYGYELPHYEIRRG